MSKYNCPIEGCNVYFEAPTDDIIPQAINHAFGSHDMQIDGQAVVEIIYKQAHPATIDEPSSVRKPKVRRKRRKARIKRGVDISTMRKDIPSNPVSKISKWWDNKKNA
jgi:hypothetical protein